MKKDEKTAYLGKWEELRKWLKYRRDSFIEKSAAAAWPYERVLEQMNLIEHLERTKELNAQNQG